jgi:MFS family permease
MFQSHAGEEETEMLETRPADRRAQGWRIVAALSATELVSWGVLYYAFGVLLKAMEAELRCTRAELTGAFSLGLFVSGLVALPLGRWVDRGGGRTLMTLGSVLAAGLLAAWSRVSGLEGLYWVWAGLGLAQAAVLYEPAFALIAAWLPHERSRALLALTLSGGFASTVFNPVTAWLLASHGWRGAVLGLAALLAAVTIPIHALVLRAAPEQRRGRQRTGAAQAPGVREVLRSPAFYALAAALAFSALQAAAVNVHVIPHLIESGYSTETAAAAAGLIGAMQVAGRLLYGLFEARGRIASGKAVVFLLQGVALLGLLDPHRPGALPFFVILFGMGNGMATLLRASVVAEWYGSENYGSIAGLLSIGNLTARAVAPFAAGVLYTATGSYRPVFLTLFVLAVAAAALVAAAEKLRAPRPPRDP